MNAIVDIHSHLYPRSYIDLLKARQEIPLVAGEPGAERFVIFRDEAVPGGGRPFGPEFWDPAEKLAFMDRTGIASSVVSLGNPWLDPFTGPEAADLARTVNAEFARLESESGSRLHGLGVLPADSLESAVAVAAEVAATPSLYGV